MINRFRIGADELILHLRKNNIAENISNDQLGKKIKNIIVDQLFGRLINEDVPFSFLSMSVIKCLIGVHLP